MVAPSGSGRADHDGHDQVAAVQGADRAERPHRLDAGAAEGDEHAVAAERADDGRQQGLVVLQAAPVQDLEGEQGRPEGGSEQHGEAGRHAGDGEDAHVGPVPAEPGADPGAERPGALHQRRLRAHGAARGHAQQRRGDQGSQAAGVLGAAEHVDVVDEQLDVAGLARQPGDQRDGRPHGHEDGELDHATVVPGPEHALQDVQGGDVGRADEATPDPDGHDGRAEAVADVHHGVGDGPAGEGAAGDGRTHRNIVVRYVMGDDPPGRDQEVDRIARRFSPFSDSRGTLFRWLRATHRVEREG